MEQPPTIPLEELLQPLRIAIDQALDQYTADLPGCPRRLTSAIRYSVLAPGKRLRPALVLLACEAASGDWAAALPAACAAEFVHVYSLVHDDLPCMDNDQLRRGRPTCHVQFDEATAVLAGDSLQMLAMEVLCQHLPGPTALRCCQILAGAAGRCRLVGGQMDDLAAEGRFEPSGQPPPRSLEMLEQIHLRKTSALIEASLQMGGTVGGASPVVLDQLAIFGRSIGLAFQIVDDCLDLESSPEQLGKTTRKDSHLGKLTYPELIGLERSRQRADELIRQACESLSDLGEQASKLNALAHYVIDRTR